MGGQVVQTVISALTVILVARIIGSESNGQVTIVMIPVSLALLLQDMGVSAALTLFSARLRHGGRMADLNMLVRTGLVFSASIALVLSAALFIFASPVAAVWLGRPDLEGLVRVASLSIVGQALVTAIQAVSMGFEMVRFRAALPIAWSVLRGVIVFPLVLLGSGAFGPVVAIAVSSFLIGLVGVALFFYIVKFGEGTGSMGASGALRLILGFGMPLYAGALVSGGLGQVYNTLMATYAPTELIGNYGAATNFGVLISFFTLPISLTLFPLFSRMSRGDPLLESLFQNALKYTHLIVTPIAACLIVVSSPMTNIIYGSGYPYASLYLSLYLVLYLFEGLGGTSLGNLISGLGESRVLFNSNVIQLLVGVPLSLILVPRYQIIGLIATMIIAPRISLIYLLVWLKKNTGFSPNWGASARGYLSAAIAFLVSYLELTLLHLSGWVALLVCSASFFAIYLVALPLSGALDLRDIQLLEEIAGVTGPLTPLFRAILSWMSLFMGR
jgi:O-antigen/teichoic acid export membrane protein